MSSVPSCTDSGPAEKMKGSNTVIMLCSILKGNLSQTHSPCSHRNVPHRSSFPLQDGSFLLYNVNYRQHKPLKKASADAWWVPILSLALTAQWTNPNKSERFYRATRKRSVKRFILADRWAAELNKAAEEATVIPGLCGRWWLSVLRCFRGLFTAKSGESPAWRHPKALYTLTNKGAPEPVLVWSPKNPFSRWFFGEPF